MYGNNVEIAFIRRHVIGSDLMTISILEISHSRHGPVTMIYRYGNQIFCSIELLNDQKC
jgi:hypothetical protein